MYLLHFQLTTTAGNLWKARLTPVLGESIAWQLLFLVASVADLG